MKKRTARGILTQRVLKESGMLKVLPEEKE